MKKCSLVQCAACGKSAGVETTGEIAPCACGSLHFVTCDRAVWRLTASDRALLHEAQIDPEASALGFSIDPSEEA